MCGSQDVEGTTCPQKLNMDLKFCVDKDPSVSKADMDTGAGVFMREAKAGWEKQMSPVTAECEAWNKGMCAQLGGKPKSSIASSCDTFCIHTASEMNAGKHCVTPFTPALLYCVLACLQRIT